MAPRQLRLFPYPRPLLERLGEEFFNALPRGPGVYFMRDAEGRILYIGQSCDLRSRLFSYKNAQPGTVPRKVIRLVHQVRSIDWERLPTPHAAIQREAALLREHRPRFNSAQTWPAAPYFFGLRRERGKLHLRWTELPKPREHEKLFGAFRGRMMARHLFRVLVRFTAICRLQPDHPQDLPLLPLLPGRHGSEWVLPWNTRARRASGDTIHRLLEHYLAGDSPELTDWAEDEVLAEGSPCHSILKHLLAEDVETLRDFYDRGPWRAATERRSLGIAETWWNPEEKHDSTEETRRRALNQENVERRRSRTVTPNVAQVSRPGVPRASRPASLRTRDAPFTKADQQVRQTAGRNACGTARLEACATCHDKVQGY